MSILSAWPDLQDSGANASLSPSLPAQFVGRCSFKKVNMQESKRIILSCTAYWPVFISHAQIMFKSFAERRWQRGSDDRLWGTE